MGNLIDKRQLFLDKQITNKWYKILRQAQQVKKMGAAADKLFLDYKTRGDK